MFGSEGKVPPRMMSLIEKPTELKLQRTELEAANEEETSKLSFQKQQL